MAKLEDLLENQDFVDFRNEEFDTEQKATLYEFQSVLLNPEEVPAGSKREFANNLLKSFRFCQVFMTALGRLPIVCFKNEDHSIHFEYHLNSVRGVLFFVTFAIFLMVTILTSCNIVSIMLNFPKQPEKVYATWDIKVSPGGDSTWESLFPNVPYLQEYPKTATVIQANLLIPKEEEILRAEEMFIFRRNVAPILMVIFLLYHILMSDWKLYCRRQFVAKYLTFWTESVEIMKIDASGEAAKFVRRFLLYYATWTFIFFIAVCSNIAPVASGAPVAFTFLWFRFLYPQIHTVSDIYITILRFCGGFVYFYAVVCSKVYVFFFLYICKLLTETCTVWNDRLEKVFSPEERLKQRKDKFASRTGYDHLFKDYVTLLDLLSGADTLFSNIIESYYSMTVISIVFEVYYLVRPVSETQTEFREARIFDMLLVGIYIFNTVLVFWMVSTGAAEVGEAASNGLEIIRRQGIMGHRHDSEMHFMISLYMSYTGHFDTSLSGGGYFILDKPFFVAMAGTMVSYIIIIFQFQPNLGLTNPDHLHLIGVNDPNPFKLRVLVMHTESTLYYRQSREPGY